MLKETLLEAANAGAAVLKEFFNQPFKISSKSSLNDLVTEADHKSEEVIFEVIRKNFPDHYLLSEETGAIVQESSYKWIIDPVDGTVNFANGIPICCVSIGLEVNGKITMGAVYNPFMNEFFFSERGLGATLNEERIHVSDKAEVLNSCLCTGFPYTYVDRPNGPLEVFGKLIRKGVPVRRLGSAAIDLCWVAAGRFDGFFEHSLHPWDSAAGYLMVEEAGGMVTDLKGNEYDLYQPGLVATNRKIHQELVRWINGEVA